MNYCWQSECIELMKKPNKTITDAFKSDWCASKMRKFGKAMATAKEQNCVGVSLDVQMKIERDWDKLCYMPIS